MILKTMDGVVMHLTDQEAKAVKQALTTSRSHVAVRGAMIPRSSIALYPSEMWLKDPNAGRLHDGTRVTRKFGRWVDVHHENATLSTEYYPEIARDEVLSEIEWHAYALDKIESLEVRKSVYYNAILSRGAVGEGQEIGQGGQKQLAS